MHKTAGGFAKRFPDRITEELVAVLSGGTALESQALFDLLLVRLRARNAAGCGAEMLRLKVYEKLHVLVNQGQVAKTVNKLGKEYRGLASLAGALPVVTMVPPVPV